MNGIAKTVAIGASAFAIAAGLLGTGVWVGAVDTKQEKHEREPHHREAGRRINLIEQRLSGLEATVRETGKATKGQIDDLKAEQRREFNEIKQMLRQRN